MFCKLFFLFIFVKSVWSAFGYFTQMVQVTIFVSLNIHLQNESIVSCFLMWNYIKLIN